LWLRLIDLGFSRSVVINMLKSILLGEINLPLDIAESRGIYKEPFGPDLGRSGKISPEFIDKASIKEGVDKEGNPMTYVEVQYQTPVNPKSKITRDMFNANILPDKLVEPGANPYQKEQLFVDEAGNVFDSKGNFKGKK